MNTLQKGIIGTVCFSLVQVCFGGVVNNISKTDDATFWDTPKSWHNTEIWSTGVVGSTNDDVSVVSKPEDLTVNLFESAVTVNTLRLGRYAGANPAVATLHVTTNLTVANFVNIAYAGGNASFIVDGAMVSSGASTSIGHADYAGTLTVDAGGVYELVGTFSMYTNSTVTVNDGIVKALAPSGSRISMKEGAAFYLNGSSQLWLGGDQTGAGSVFNGYVDNGWIYGDGVAGNVQAVYDGEKTIVTVPEPATLGLFTVSSVGILLCRKMLR